MKIAIPTHEKNGENSAVFGHFGSAPYYALYETDTGKLNIIENSEKEHAHGMCHPAQELLNEKVNAVVCSGIGLRAIQKLAEIGMKAYFCPPPATVSEVILKLKKGELQEFQASQACSHDNCH